MSECRAYGMSSDEHWELTGGPSETCVRCLCAQLEATQAQVAALRVALQLTAYANASHRCPRLGPDADPDEGCIDCESYAATDTALSDTRVAAEAHDARVWNEAIEAAAKYAWEGRWAAGLVRAHSQEIRKDEAEDTARAIRRALKREVK